LWESARHWEGAGRPEWSRATMLKAGEHLAQQGFPDEAANVYEWAIQFITDPHERLRLLRRRIDHLETAGRIDAMSSAIRQHEALASSIEPGYDQHNDLEMLLVFADHRSTGMVEVAVERTFSCARDERASSSHRLRAAKECGRVAGLVRPAVLEELRNIVDEIQPQSALDRANKERFDFEYEFWVGSPPAAAALGERLVAARRADGTPRQLNVALEMCASAYALIGRIPDAKAALGEAVRIARKYGLLDAMVAAQDASISLSLEFDDVKVTRLRLEEARAAIAEFAAAGGRSCSQLFANHEAELVISEGRPADALHLAWPLDDAVRITVSRWRARILAIHLAARLDLDVLEGVEGWIEHLESCFDRPMHWADWPAAVFGRYLRRQHQEAAAVSFLARYASEIRRETYPIPDWCGPKDQDRIIAPAPSQRAPERRLAQT
jgi:hypothetical protein